MAGFGAFGKIPALGDFLRINLARSFVDPWDIWLQQVIASSRGTLGPRWQECYMSAPIWRFTLSPGLAGPSAWLGVLMPSVDRVGRQFPLTLATAIKTDPVSAHMAGSAVFASLEQIALDALEDSASRNSLGAELAELEPPVSGLETPVPFCALLKPSLWSALVGDRYRSIAFEGLPSPEETLGFFDLQAVHEDTPDVLGLSA